MRAAHSLKGAARMTGIDNAVALGHAMEDILSAVQLAKRTVDSSVVDLLLSANDVFLRTGELPAAEIPAGFEREAGRIRELAEQLASAPMSAPAPVTVYDPFL